MAEHKLIETALRTIQARQALMLDLLQGQRKTSDPEVMMRAAAEAVGRYLGADRVGFFEMRDDDTLDFSVGWTAGRLPLLTGLFPAVGIGTRYLTEVRAGKTMGISDAATDPLTADSVFSRIGTVSLIGAPIIRNGRWHAGLYVNHSEVRHWPPADVALVRDVAELTWDAIERVRAESALRKSEERLTLALDAGGGVGAWDWDIASDRVYCNARFAQLFSVDPRRAAAGAPMSDFLDAIHPEDRPRVGEGIRHAVEIGGDFAEEYRVVQADGTARWVYARGRCHLDEAAKAGRFPGVVFDITERKKADAALQQQWRTFDTALSNTPDFTYIFDLEGRFTYVNRALLSLWQKTLEEAVGKNFFELDYPLDLAERLQRQIQQVIATKAAVRDQTPFMGPTGETRHYEYIFVPVFAANGRVDAVAGSTRDITEQRGTEDALRGSEARFRFLAETIPPMVWTATPEGALDYVNERAASYFGVALEALLGAGWLTLVHPDEREKTVERWRQSLTTGEPYEISFRLRRGSDASWRWHLARALPLFGEGGNVVQWFGTCTDIEGQKATEAELMRANRELEEFAYVASHDLQEPLRMVNIYTEMILERVGAEDPGLHQYAGFIRQGVVRMQSLIHDLLTFSRIVHTDEISAGADLTASLAEAKAVFKNRVEEVGATILAPSLPTVRGDTSQLAHVFQNLLSNALKYRKKDLPPEIVISASRRGDQWVIAVRDNGIGFDQQYAERIFGLFKRLHKDEFPGTGLGLAICRRIIERYGGRIWAEGRPGDGATFFFSLPAE